MRGTFLADVVDTHHSHPQMPGTGHGDSVLVIFCLKLFYIRTIEWKDDRPELTMYTSFVSKTSS